MAYHFGARCESVKLPSPIAFAPSFKETVIGKDGKVETLDVSSSKPIPDPSTTDLEALIDAGIPLQRTNSKVIQSDKELFMDALSRLESDELNSIEEQQTTQTTQTTQTSEV